MIQLRRTDSTDRDFLYMVKYLDEDLRERDGEEHAFYAQYNKTELIRYVVVAYSNDQPVGCGALKEYSADTAEIKRMFTSAESRGKGIASLILKELENWASELSYAKCILETGKKQPEAIRLYQKNGYVIIPNYGQYAGIINSLCFEKALY
ncbi:GNAT family N-acetyltransferase [Sinomicrobium sp. M5D2P17]